MNVLVPIDDSAPARAALEYAVTTHPDADITALHAASPSVSTYDVGVSAADIERRIEVEKRNAKPLLETARRIAAEHDASVTTETVVGVPSRAIVSFAAENDIEQIVLGSHGRAGVSRVLLGSVAEGVMSRASVPVTVVR
ncbi:universal stress protein [Halopiger djelfimassiliensis]|uniref:universal stress protein n=1 Tax=Halopiger djelfimassiliensis TaxID=1293047 RepID=UPI000677F341|nr:universal stress protein [Halopiger djelfimassiliensis]